VRPCSAILADDEPHLLAQLRGHLLACWPELSVVGEAHDGPSALELIETRGPDVAFLDIKMPGMSGLEVARRCAGRCHVVFVTAFDDYAVEAFERAAVDYLLKPVERERLASTVARLKRSLGPSPPDLAGLFESLAAGLKPAPSHLEWLQVQHRQDLVLVPVEDVDVFQAADKYTLALSHAEEYVLRTTLKELEEQLDPARFWRVHRNAIVRVAAIARASRGLAGRLVLHLRERDRVVPVSRAYAHRFRQM